MLTSVAIVFSCIAAPMSSDTISRVTDYRLILMDSPAQLFTMRQFDETYLSCDRLLARGLYAAMPNDRVADAILGVAHAFLLMPISHEEGHRSILTARNIGSVSQPYFGSNGAAYVKGVTDRTLQDLRDTDLPTYIRLHTAGVESDYLLTKRVETIGSFNLDDFRNYRWEYWVRKLAILQYYVSGLFKVDADIKEESDERERDIVGYDTYGAARHLYRPAMEFYRYTLYNDMTAGEQAFIKRAGWRSLLNIINPLMLGRESFKISETLHCNGGLGYTMSPFGDFIDENIWVRYRLFNIGFYAREFQARDNWSFGCGLSLTDYRPIERLSISAAGHVWQQPEALSFTTSQLRTGGAVELDAGYFFINRKDTLRRGFSVDLGLTYKTAGFLPEEVILDEHFGFRIGTTLRL